MDDGRGMYVTVPAESSRRVLLDILETKSLCDPTSREIERISAYLDKKKKRYKLLFPGSMVCTKEHFHDKVSEDDFVLEPEYKLIAGKESYKDSGSSSDGKRYQEWFPLVMWTLVVKGTTFEIVDPKRQPKMSPFEKLTSELAALNI